MRQPTKQFIRRRPTPPARRARRRRGFSLAELMISIGILLVGLVMAASLFPAAMVINRRSVRDVLGAIICENGIALAKARFASGGASDPPNVSGKMTVLADDKHEDYFSIDMCRFPQGDTASPFGFTLIYRYLDADDDFDTKEGHQLAVVAYRRRAPVSAGKAVQVAGAVMAKTGDKASLKIGPVAGDSFRIDSPVFDRLTGEFVIIRQIYGASGYASTAIVNRQIQFSSEADSDTAYLYVIKEQDENRYSPALMAMVTRVPLDWH